MLDVSRATAEQLGFIDAGATQLKVIVISGPVQGDEYLLPPARSPRAQSRAAR